MNDPVRDHLPARRKFLKVALAAGVSARGGNAFAGTSSERIEYWDNHAGFGYAGPRDVDLLDQWRSAGVKYPASIKDVFLPPSILPQVGEQLRSLGYKESSIRAIMSENFMRVASQVWAK